MHVIPNLSQICFKMCYKILFFHTVLDKGDISRLVETWRAVRLIIWCLFKALCFKYLFPRQGWGTWCVCVGGGIKIVNSLRRI